MGFVVHSNVLLTTNDKKKTPEKICNVSRRLTDDHDPNTCDVCQI